MSDKSLKTAVTTDGRTIQVYKHHKANQWVDYADCKTIYQKSELKFKD